MRNDHKTFRFIFYTLQIYKSTFIPNLINIEYLNLVINLIINKLFKLYDFRFNNIIFELICINDIFHKLSYKIKFIL